MKTLRYSLRLTSDAEPGTGLAAEFIDQVVPRDHHGDCMLRASHLKGLMRQALDDLSWLRGWNEVSLLERVFGREGENGGSGRSSSVLLRDLVAKGVEVRTITRTAVSEAGPASHGSLRTTEALPVGTTFVGEIRYDESDPIVEPALKLALLGLMEVGSSRNRGAGACVVEVENETLVASELLPKLAKSLEIVPRAPDHKASAPVADTDDLGHTEWLRVSFKAETPICCPEIPAIRANVIRSGPAIPASAVQGAVLTVISRRNPGLASACVGHSGVRFWPLLPSGIDKCEGIPTRVSLTHKISKLPYPDGHYDFRDGSVEPFDWTQVAADRPLKSADGVIIGIDSETRKLWKFGDLPRVVTAHAVHAGPDLERNLFSVESVAPVYWTGMIAMPTRAVEALRAALAEDDNIAIGKARSVRGQGSLCIEKVLSADDDEFQGCVHVLVAQEAIAVPDGVEIREAGDALRSLAEPCLGRVKETHAKMSCRFGWNRHGVGRTLANGSRLRATRVFLPGSVVVLEEPLRGESLRKALLTGIGVGRDQCFGALRPHPGVATDLFRRQVPISTCRTPAAAAIKEVLEVRELGAPPSASQISQLIAPLSRDNKVGALDFLKRQRDRANKAWDVWKPFHQFLLAFIEKHKPEEAAIALGVWRDLVKVEKEKRS
jgi:hypothetical protein